MNRVQTPGASGGDFFKSEKSEGASIRICAAATVRPAMGWHEAGRMVCVAMSAPARWPLDRWCARRKEGHPCRDPDRDVRKRHFSPALVHV